MRLSGSGLRMRLNCYLIQSSCQHLCGQGEGSPFCVWFLLVRPLVFLSLSFSCDLYVHWVILWEVLCVCVCVCVHVHMWYMCVCLQDSFVIHLVPGAVSFCSFFSSPGEGGCTVITSSIVDPTTIILAPGMTFSSLKVWSSFTKPEITVGLHLLQLPITAHT